MRPGASEYIGAKHVSNVVEFKRPPKPKEPKPPRPGLKKLLVALGVIAAFVLAWAYFNYFGS